MKSKFVAAAMILAAGFVLTAHPSAAGGCGSGETTTQAQVVPTTGAAPATSHDAKAEDAKSMNIVQTAISAGSFKTLVAAVQAAGLAETLSGKGPFTVFAPTDEAFAKLPKGTVEELLKPENKAKLTAILTYHVVPGNVMAADVVKLSSAKTLQGQELAIAVSGGKVMVGNAQVAMTDVKASNGVIHVVDTVLLPKEM